MQDALCPHGNGLAAAAIVKLGMSTTSWLLSGVAASNRRPRASCCAFQRHKMPRSDAASWWAQDALYGDGLAANSWAGCRPRRRRRRGALVRGLLVLLALPAAAALPGPRRDGAAIRLACTTAGRPRWLPASPRRVPIRSHAMTDLRSSSTTSACCRGWMCGPPCRSLHACSSQPCRKLAERKLPQVTRCNALTTVSGLTFASRSS